MREFVSQNHAIYYADETYTPLDYHVCTLNLILHAQRFVAACTAIAFINELATLSVFSWLALLSVYACWTVTVACREHILTLYRVVVCFSSS